MIENLFTVSNTQLAFLIGMGAEAIAARLTRAGQRLRKFEAQAAAEKDYPSHEYQSKTRELFDTQLEVESLQRQQALYAWLREVLAAEDGRRLCLALDDIEQLATGSIGARAVREVQ